MITDFTTTFISSPPRSLNTSSGAYFIDKFRKECVNKCMVATTDKLYTKGLEVHELRAVKDACAMPKHITASEMIAAGVVSKADILKLSPIGVLRNPYERILSAFAWAVSSTHNIVPTQYDIESHIIDHRAIKDSILLRPQSDWFMYDNSLLVKPITVKDYLLRFPTLPHVGRVHTPELTDRIKALLAPFVEQDVELYNQVFKESI